VLSAVKFTAENAEHTEENNVQFTDGITTISFWPTSYELAVDDFTELYEARQGDVIAAAAAGGILPRRRRRVGLIRKTSELTTLRNFFSTNDGKTFRFTDDAGREWNVKWLEALESSEAAVAHDGAGWHEVTVELLLESVYSDAALEAWPNTDAGQMSIQKSGASILHFPLAYAPPLGRRDHPTAYKSLAPGKLAVDAGRYTAKRRHSLEFRGLARAFMIALEDYYVNTIQGAAHPFSLAHFRDGTLSCRWLDGLRFNQDEGGRYGGGFTVMQEI
jgi:hypothetical protein